MNIFKDDITKNGLGKINSVEEALEKVCKGLNKKRPNPKFVPNGFKILTESPKDISYKYTYQFPFGIWFRGNSNAGHELLPAVLRNLSPTKGEEEYYKEGAMFSSFKMYNPSFGQEHKTDFDWLTLMQHYGLPTRLLDWSENILVALYNATEHSRVNKKNDTDGRLYILNARRLNRIYRFADDIIVTDKSVENAGNKGMLTPDTFDVDCRVSLINGGLKSKILKIRDINKLQTGDDNPKDKYKLLDKWLKNRPLNNNDKEIIKNKVCAAIAVFPRRINDRMQAQQSMFTLHGGKRYVDSETGYTKDNEIGDPICLRKLNQNLEYPFLGWYTIPKETKEFIREELRRIGIHEGFLYPEIDRQSEYLKKIWKVKNEMPLEK